MGISRNFSKLADDVDSTGKLTPAAGGLPTQTSQSGKYLTTDGSTPTWAAVDSLPSQTSQSGKYLTTNGTTASWGTVTPPTATAVSDSANTSTGYFTLPAGTTAQRPASPTNGMLRFNTTLGYNEWYSAPMASWYPMYQSSSLAINYLIVAGGGAGGGNGGGGGGAGGGAPESAGYSSAGGTGRTGFALQCQVGYGGHPGRGRFWFCLVSDQHPGDRLHLGQLAACLGLPALAGRFADWATHGLYLPDRAGCRLGFWRYSNASHAPWFGMALAG